MSKFKIQNNVFDIGILDLICHLDFEIYFLDIRVRL